MDSPRDIAIAAVRNAGSKLLELSTREIGYTMKNTHDIQAEGDLISEKILIDSIRGAFPDHGFFSEEAGKGKSADYMWIIDPIDGTINFSRGLDDYCISVALTHKGTRELGIVYQPVMDKMYIAEKGTGAFLNGKKMEVSKETTLVNSILATDNTSKPESRTQNFAKLGDVCLSVRNIRILGSSAIHLAKIAEGKLDVYFKTRVNYWDYAAGILLVEEAGGKATDFHGEKISESSENIIVTNGHLHDQLLNLL